MFSLKSEKMKLFAILAAAVYGGPLQCHVCSTTDLSSCNNPQNCVDEVDPATDDGKVYAKAIAAAPGSESYCMLQVTFRNNAVQAVSSGCSTEKACTDKQRDNRVS